MDTINAEFLYLTRRILEEDIKTLSRIVDMKRDTLVAIDALIEARKSAQFVT